MAERPGKGKVGAVKVTSRDQCEGARPSKALLAADPSALLAGAFMNMRTVCAFSLQHTVSRAATLACKLCIFLSCSVTSV
jgi:hypothetical protein